MKFPDQLNQKLSYLPPRSLELVKKAWIIADRVHRDQKRLSGEDYINHPLQTALYLADLKLDFQTICAALLHDTVEDTGLKLSEVEKKFGRSTAKLVDGVTKLGKIRLRKTWFGWGGIKKEKLPEFERQAETLRKMILAMANDIRVVLIKLADRRHNMLTLADVPAPKRERIARETLDIYAPLAHRLGMGELKGEIEDLAFPYAYPQEYQKLTQQVKEVSRSRERIAEEARRDILKLLAKGKIFVLVHGRAKHWYSLWLKLQKPKYDNDITRIHDLVAIRVITDSVEKCYQILGMIHSKWKPLPGRFKDYIAAPKPNGYQSLHTEVFGPGGAIIEIQIRTEKMHEQAEFGIAAHWFRSQHKTSSQYLEDRVIKAPLKETLWVKELAKWQRALKDPTELRQSLTTDFFKDRIFVYTPKGDVLNLPSGSTPIDFAYAVHSEVGEKMVGVKINGSMANFSDRLQNGAVVEILTNKKSAGPKSDWLELSVSNTAHYHIRRQLRRNRLISNFLHFGPKYKNKN